MHHRTKLNELFSEMEKDIQAAGNETSKIDIQQWHGANINVSDKCSVTIGNITIGGKANPSDKHTNNCKACGHIVAKAAKSCPNCGQPSKTSKFKRHILLCAMLLAPLVNGPPPLFGFFH